VPGEVFHSSSYQITSDGSLYVKSILKNGTFYCQHSNKIWSTYSVTTTRLLKRAHLIVDEEKTVKPVPFQVIGSSAIAKKKLQQLQTMLALGG